MFFEFRFCGRFGHKKFQDNEKVTRQGSDVEQSKNSSFSPKMANFESLPENAQKTHIKILQRFSLDSGD